MEADPFWCYLWWYSASSVVVFSKTSFWRWYVSNGYRNQEGQDYRKTYRLKDSGGMFLFVTPAGGKLWRWKYRFDSKQKLMSLGKYPDISLAEARERHAQARKLLANGTDPMAKRKEVKTEELVQTEGSFQNVASLWLDHWADGKSPRHVE